MKDFVLPPLAEEPRILEDQVHTWTVESWRNLGKKEHGPVFMAGGFPWSVTSGVCISRPGPDMCCTGESFCSRSAIAAISLLSTSNMGLSQKMFPRTGAAASSSPWCYGIPTSRPSSFTTLLTIVSPRRKVTGVLRDFWSCERCSMLHGRVLRGR